MSYCAEEDFAFKVQGADVAKLMTAEWPFTKLLVLLFSATPPGAYLYSLYGTPLGTGEDAALARRTIFSTSFHLGELTSSWCYTTDILQQ